MYRLSEFPHLVPLDGVEVFTLHVIVAVKARHLAQDDLLWHHHLQQPHTGAGP